MKLEQCSILKFILKYKLFVNSKKSLRKQLNDGLI